MASPEFLPADEQLRAIRRGAAGIVVEAELREKLERSRRTGTPLKVKLGLDPTAPDLHLGHTVVLRKLRDFQDLGHQIIVIIGDFTGMIGDPTGRSETRKPLTWEEIRANAETYRTQLGKVVDMSRARVEFNSTGLGKVVDMSRARVEFNSSWLGALTFENVIRETAHLTVARMLQREDFAQRYAAERPISLHEFLYPIAQAYDSVALGADVELGGTDQTFNLLVGRDLQRAHGQAPQIAVTVPILEGLDGSQKMSKSLGNYVGIGESPAEIFGKLMSVSDALMWRYYEVLTRIPETDLETLRAGHPMDAKKRLARTITAQYHGEAAAGEAEAGFTRVFQERQRPQHVEEVRLETAGESIPLARALRDSRAVASTSEARRKIQEGAVEVDDIRILDGGATLATGRTYTVRVGKRTFRRITIVKTPDA